ncbi:hypothetical protein IM660_14985 [Ruania alkalisoli]|uniref:DUF1700 domain-containing protein n=1 Tax=Ruania alkalisoli TaxID=2779775 RepID=A0A7M1SQT5_9MICO|nr:hypothetical protein [Ruania alkalisoli]QOR69938.1 hypothetical protein IM660_14985 [Ruania alkalisoli]
MTETVQRLARYQDDLARLLAALEPAERAEVLDGVREHIEAALAEVPGEASEADVNRILAELGSPGQVAEAALAERPATGPYTPGATGVVTTIDLLRSKLVGRWVPPVALVAVMVGGAFVFWGFPAILLGAGILAIAIAPLWTGAERVWGAIGLPLCSFMIFPGSLLFLRASVGGISLFTVGFYLFAAASVTIAIVLVIRGSRRAAQYARTHHAAPASGGVS